MTTIYIDRNNTNEEVFHRANTKLEEDGNAHRLVQFSTAYQRRKLMLLQNIIAFPDDDPVKQATFDPKTLKRNELGFKRVGRPRLNWTEQTMEEYWTEIQPSLPAHLLNVKLNLDIPEHVERII